MATHARKAIPQEKKVIGNSRSEMKENQASVFGELLEHVQALGYLTIDHYVQRNGGLPKEFVSANKFLNKKSEYNWKKKSGYKRGNYTKRDVPYDVMENPYPHLESCFGSSFRIIRDTEDCPAEEAIEFRKETGIDNACCICRNFKGGRCTGSAENFNAEAIKDKNYCSKFRVQEKIVARDLIPKYFSFKHDKFYNFLYITAIKKLYIKECDANDFVSGFMQSDDFYKVIDVSEKLWIIFNQTRMPYLGRLENGEIIENSLSPRLSIKKISKIVRENANAENHFRCSSPQEALENPKIVKLLGKSKKAKNLFDKWVKNIKDYSGKKVIHFANDLVEHLDNDSEKKFCYKYLKAINIDKLTVHQLNAIGICEEEYEEIKEADKKKLTKRLTKRGYSEASVTAEGYSGLYIYYPDDLAKIIFHLFKQAFTNYCKRTIKKESDHNKLIGQYGRKFLMTFNKKEYEEQENTKEITKSNIDKTNALKTQFATKERAKAIAYKVRKKEALKKYNNKVNFYTIENSKYENIIAAMLAAFRNAFTESGVNALDDMLSREDMVLNC